jgi:hypothetical protein
MVTTRDRRALLKEFVQILKSSGFIDQAKQVKLRDYSQTPTNEEFEVTTDAGLNIGNLISIEEKTGFGITYVCPVEGNQIRARFCKLPQHWRRSFKDKGIIEP